MDASNSIANWLVKSDQSNMGEFDPGIIVIETDGRQFASVVCEIDVIGGYCRSTSFLSAITK